ncbi:MAG: hypothetical protein WAL80_16570 [Xanthobacteraceae bacterium]|jgi:hypothetical protein
MFNTAKFAIAAAIVLGATFSVSAATGNHVANVQTANNNVIPGYDSQGRTVSIPNPDRRGQ